MLAFVQNRSCAVALVACRSAEKTSAFVPLIQKVADLPLSLFLNPPPPPHPSSLDFPSKSQLSSLSATHLQKLSVSFSLKDPAGKAFVPQQVGAG